MYQEIPVAQNEVLIRIFFRGDVSPRDETNLSDFDRRLKVRGRKEGGLSLCRPTILSYRAIIVRVKTRERDLDRGFGYIQAKALFKMGYSFYGDPRDPGHVCLHCGSCNKQIAACSCNSGPCPFDPNDPDPTKDDVTREYLASITNVLFDAKPTSEFERIFGLDVDDSDAMEANKTYVSRWQADKFKIH